MDAFDSEAYIRQLKRQRHREAPGMGGAEQLFRVVPLPSPMRERKSYGPSNARLPNGSVKARRVSGGVLFMSRPCRVRHDGSWICCQARQYWHHAACVDSETTGIQPPAVWVFISAQAARVRERGRHVSCGEPAIVKWISSESVRAPIFFMAVARWVSTVLWLMPRT